MNLAIRIFVTGGTFDKGYDELAGSLAFRDTHLPEMLRLGRSRVEVSVQIANRNYELACGDGEEERVQELAAYVDEKVAELRRQLPGTPEVKLLVFAALIGLWFTSSFWFFTTFGIKF